MTQQKEARLVNEYLAEFWRYYPQWKRVRLGKACSHEEAAMYKCCLRWADAIIDAGDEIIIIEGKLKPNAGAVGQLEQYKKLFRETPEFAKYAKHHIKLVLLSAVWVSDIADLCREKEIQFTLYNREWVNELY